MKIMILCSKHFYSKIPEVKEYLEYRGHKVKLPNSYEEPFAEEKFKKMSREEHTRWKAEMMGRDEKNILPQDAVLVLNLQKGELKNYVGGATFLEVYTAWKLNKKIFFYNNLPDCSFTDELMGINPTVLNGNLEKIK